MGKITIRSYWPSGDNRAEVAHYYSNDIVSNVSTWVITQLWCFGLASLQMKELPLAEY
jgi:hypothetical protein